MSAELTEKVDFSIIRYANCWEDADILIKGLAPEKNERLLSVGSAGDNSFSLLTGDPELVVAVDVNQVQLFLIELKKTCIRHLEREETLAFLGFNESLNRAETFNKLKTTLGAETRAYFEKHIDLISRGIVHEGKFEKYFRLFSKRILPLIHSKKTTNRLLEKKPLPSQIEFYDKRWNSWRWRLLFKLFFSKTLMGRFGRDPEFLKQVDVQVGKFIFNKAQDHLKSTAAQDNFILRYCLTASFDSLLPHYLKPANYEKIRGNLSRLQLRKGYAQDAIAEFGTFHKMNLSDIFEYMPQSLFKKTGEELLKGLEVQGRMAYWNLMVPRRLSKEFPLQLNYLSELSPELSQRDKGFFYNQFIVDQKI